MPEILTIPQTTSTNDDLAALARDGASEGLWLRAETQTGGRGRQGRAWSSPPGNLYASTLVRLRPTDPPAPTLALVAGVALHEVAAAIISPLFKGGDQGVGGPFVGSMPAKGHSRGHRARSTATHPQPLPVREGRLILKWPNDLLAGPAKLAGILLERERDAVVVGIGANLASHPYNLGRPATSLAALTGAAPDPAQVVEQLAEAFARWLARWRSDGLAPIRAAWCAAAHPPGTTLRTAEGDGLFDGLDTDGALRLRLADGAIRVIHAGDVLLI